MTEQKLHRANELYEQIKEIQFDYSKLNKMTYDEIRRLKEHQIEDLHSTAVCALESLLSYVKDEFKNL